MSAVTTQCFSCRTFLTGFALLFPSGFRWTGCSGHFCGTAMLLLWNGHNRQWLQLVSLLDLKYYGEKSAFGNKTFPRKTDKLENALLAIKQASQLKKKSVGHVYSRQSFPLCLINSVYSFYSTEWHRQGKCQLKCLNQINFPFFVMRFFWGIPFATTYFSIVLTDMLPHKSASRSNCDNIRINWHVCAPWLQFRKWGLMWMWFVPLH